MRKLSEHDFWQSSFKFDNKMDLTIRMKIICNLKHRRAIRLKYGDIILTSLTKLVIEENILL